MSAPRLTQYAAYIDPDTNHPRIGHFDLANNTIQPLYFSSGAPVSNLYQVIDAGSDRIVAGGSPVSASRVRLLAPISGRDVLAVGKNYMEHAKEFNSSGFDSSDKVALPSHPVIFTKRATSIIAHGEDIVLPSSDFSQTVDYEGEIGVIIGRSGTRIEERDAWDYVWGYTIINDVTARERQRDHKQFFIGKSADTFCPMGPIAVPKEDLPSTLRVQTHVNGELRQDATSEDLIFSIPTLVSTISSGQTVRPGDVIATGTPAGVGIGRTPPVYLKAGDEVTISITGLGILSNTVQSRSNSQILDQSEFGLVNSTKSIGGNAGLATINSKPLNYQTCGSGEDHIIFSHGIGGTLEFWMPLISALQLDKSHALHLFDLEGFGASPTHPLSEVSVESIAADIAGIFQHAKLDASKPATIVAHSLSCLAAIEFTLRHPDLVKQLVLLGPPPVPTPEKMASGLLERAALVRTKGIRPIIDAFVAASTSQRTRDSSPLAVAAVRLSLLGQDPEGYAKGCSAVAHAPVPDLERLKTKVIIVNGEDDKISSPSVGKHYAEKIEGAELVALPHVGHWHVYEDLQETASAIKGVLKS